MAQKRLGDYMVEKGYASTSEIAEAYKFQSTTGGDLVGILVHLGLNPKHVYEAKAQEMEAHFVDLSVYRPETGLIDIVPEFIVRRHNVLPLKKDGHILYVAMADPGDLVALDDVRLASQCTVHGVVAVPEEIKDAITRLYSEKRKKADEAKEVNPFLIP